MHLLLIRIFGMQKNLRSPSKVLSLSIGTWSKLLHNSPGHHIGIRDLCHSIIFEFSSFKVIYQCISKQIRMIYDSYLITRDMTYRSVNMFHFRAYIIYTSATFSAFFRKLTAKFGKWNASAWNVEKTKLKTTEFPFNKTKTKNNFWE